MNGKAPQEGQGAVLLSVRSQTQLMGPLYFWFQRADGQPQNKNNLVRISRGQGVPLLGFNMFSSEPKVYSLPAGRYRLIAHVVHCDDVPYKNSICVVTYGSVEAKHPTGTYEEPSISFTVEPGKFTDAGEFILELPNTEMVKPDARFTDVYNVYGLHMKVRWKPIANAEAYRKGYEALPVGGGVEVAEGYASKVKCETVPKDQRSSLYIPFEC